MVRAGVDRLVVVESTFCFVPRVYLAGRGLESVVEAELVDSPVEVFVGLVGSTFEVWVGLVDTEIEE